LTKTFYTLIFILIITSCSDNQCGFSDGKYQVIYDKEFSSFEYEVKSDTVKEIYQDNHAYSIIEWISDDEYFLSDLVSHLAYKDDLNKEQYIYGKPFYRLINCRKDTIDFTLMRNQNSIINTGKLIKVD